jgi:hypothetical protein
LTLCRRLAAYRTLAASRVPAKEWEEAVPMGWWERIHAERPGRAATGPTVGDALAQAKALRNEVWGRPGRCPECGGFGYLDRIDLLDRIQEQHCVECWHKWTISEADTVQA